jgi:cytoskeletal protein CcmA (bactofilin family)
VSAAGAIVSVRGTVREDLRAAGAEVAGARLSIDLVVGGELNAAGARVLVGTQTHVRGATQLAGADVVFAGNSSGPATIYGDSVRIDGQIAGDVTVRARNVTVGRTAVIDGAIRFETLGEPVIEEGATLRGRQTVTLSPPQRIEGEHIVAALGALVLFGIGAGFVPGIILLIGAKPFVERGIAAIRNQPGATLLTGLGVVVLVPLAALLLMITVVGIPVGVLTLLAFPLAMMVGGVLAAFALSDWLMNRERASRSFWGRVGLLLVGLAILTLVSVVPLLGFFAGLAALLVGLGALWRGMQTPAEA